MGLILFLGWVHWRKNIWHSKANRLGDDEKCRCLTKCWAWAWFLKWDCVVIKGRRADKQKELLVLDINLDLSHPCIFHECFFLSFQESKSLMEILLHFYFGFGHYLGFNTLTENCRWNIRHALCGLLDFVMFRFSA